ncbi:MAG: hypothetical protein ABJP70_00990 [Erythrobacter sp.]
MSGLSKHFRFGPWTASVFFLVFGLFVGAALYPKYQDFNHLRQQPDGLDDDLQEFVEAVTKCRGRYSLSSDYESQSCRSAVAKRDAVLDHSLRQGFTFTQQQYIQYLTAQLRLIEVENRYFRHQSS